MLSLYLMPVNPSGREHKSQHPTHRKDFNQHMPLLGAQVNQAQGKQDFIVLVLMELLVVFFQVAFSLKSYQPFESCPISKSSLLHEYARSQCVALA